MDPRLMMAAFGIQDPYADQNAAIDSANAMRKIQADLTMQDAKRAQGNPIAEQAMGNLPSVWSPESMTQLQAQLAPEMDPAERAMRQYQAMASSPDPSVQKAGLDGIAKAYQMQNSLLSGAEQGKVTWDQYSKWDEDTQERYRKFRGFQDPAKIQMLDLVNELPDGDIKNKVVNLLGMGDLVDLGDQFLQTGTGEIIDKRTKEALIEKGVAENDIEFMSGYMDSDSAQSSFYDELDYTKELLADLDNITDYSTAGLATFISGIPLFDANKWRSRRDTIVSRLGFDKLKDLKSQSSTGASGLGSTSEREIIMLEKNLNNLEQSNTPREIRRNIAMIIRRIGKIQGSIKDKQKRNWDRFNKLAPDFNKDILAGDNPYINKNTIATGGDSQGGKAPVLNPNYPEFNEADFNPKNGWRGIHHPRNARGWPLQWSEEDRSYYYVNPKNPDEYQEPRDIRGG